MRDIAVLLHNIRSAHNVGSIFRTADAAGVSRIMLSGYTPTPTDRFDRPQKEIAKTALGAEASVPWTYKPDALAVLSQMRDEGFTIVGIEQDARSVDYRDYAYKGKLLFVLGSEVEGIDSAVLNACDTILEIPMRGAKESLNVSVAAGIVLFRAIDQ